MVRISGPHKRNNRRDMYCIEVLGKNINVDLIKIKDGKAHLHLMSTETHVMSTAITVEIKRQFNKGISC